MNIDQLACPLLLVRCGALASRAPASGQAIKEFNMSFLKSAVAAAGLMALMGSASAVVLIDDFTKPVPDDSQFARDTCNTTTTNCLIVSPATSQRGSGGAGAAGASSSLAAPTANIIGGTRDIFVIELADANSTESVSAGVAATVTNGAFNFVSDSLQTGVGIIRWDGGVALADNTGFDQSGANDLDQNLQAAIDSINKTGFMSGGAAVGRQDLTVGGATGFIVTVLNSDAIFPFTLQVFSLAMDGTTIGGSVASTDTATVGPGRTFSSPHDFFIPFAAFVQSPFYTVAADFTKVTALQAIINFGLDENGQPIDPVQDVDITIRLAETGIVPEPAGLALVGLGLVGAGLARRRLAASK